MHSVGRWNTIGRPIVYLSGSSAGALLEVLVHLPLKQDEIPDEYTLLRVIVPAGLKVVDLDPGIQSWETKETLTREMGNSWLEAGESALARVPSAIVTESWNYLLNPVHPDAKKIQIAAVSSRPYDMRLLRIRDL